MMAALAPESARSGATIRELYQAHLNLLLLHEYAELTGALDNGGLVPLPDDPIRYNLAPRLAGTHPIGEKDLDNQSSYLAARPATIGALLDIASRVKSGPVEITSLVRHTDYQDALRSTNANATTSVPMHTMGLAVDIGLVNSKLATVYELRDVLRKMQANGDILFIGERHQLVFHVVPHPSRLGYYTDLYMKAIGAPPTSQSAHVVAFASHPVVRPSAHRPQVTSEVVAVIPAEGQVLNWWTDTAGALPVPVDPPALPVNRLESLTVAFASVEVAAGRWLTLVAGLFLATWRITARRPPVARLFEHSS
jgi:hypothetical protein